MGLSDREYMQRGETDPHRAYTPDGKTMRQEAIDSAGMLGCGLFATLCLVIGLFLAAVVILLGE